MPATNSGDLTPAQIIAVKRLANKSAKSQRSADSVDLNSMVTVDLDGKEMERPQRKAKVRANEEKVWNSTRSTRKCAPTTTELEQQKSKAARSMVHSPQPEVLPQVSHGSRVQVMKKEAEAPGSTTAKPSIKSRGTSHKISASIGIEVDSEIELSEGDEDDCKQGQITDEDAGGFESNDEFLDSLVSDPVKLKDTLSLEDITILTSNSGERNQCRLFGSPNWPPHTDVYLQPDGSISLKAQQPHIRKILHTAINLFLKAIVFNRAFPNCEEKRKMAVAALFEAAREDKESDIMRCLWCDSEYSNYLASVPEARLASHRLGFKKVAQPIVIASYGLKKGCSKLVTELLINNNFIYPQTAKGDAIRNLPFIKARDATRQITFSA
ncbi:hypothetical protein BDN67DRAFT_1012820 [Paxillus ammoniavirescens]|nr:hypothetical protein BDN67DRAFT_1012820 [Paxillus ammoniavirescens]